MIFYYLVKNKYYIDKNLLIFCFLYRAKRESYILKQLAKKWNAYSLAFGGWNFNFGT